MRSLIVPALVLAAASTAAGADPRPPLFSYGGAQYNERDLSPKLRQLLYQVDRERHERRLALIDEALYELYVEQEAARRGVTAQAVGAELVAYEAPTEGELRAFYEQNRARIGEPFEAVRSRIDQFLRQARLQARKDEALAMIKRQKVFRALIEAPPLPPAEVATEGYPSKGPEDAPVTVVEFGDYQCPRCRSAAAALDATLERFDGQVRIVYRDFPVNASGISRRVAAGGVCAQRQGRFWDYHDLAYARQPVLDKGSPRAIAGELGLDMEAFAACLADPAARARVAGSADEAVKLGVRATPAVYVNGEPLESGDLGADLDSVIRDYLDGPADPLPAQH